MTDVQPGHCYKFDDVDGDPKYFIVETVEEKGEHLRIITTDGDELECFPHELTQQPKSHYWLRKAGINPYDESYQRNCAALDFSEEVYAVFKEDEMDSSVGKQKICDKTNIEQKRLKQILDCRGKSLKLKEMVAIAAALGRRITFTLEDIGSLENG